MDLTATNSAMTADYAHTPRAVLEPGITVVVPVYNRELMARATLRSIAGPVSYTHLTLPTNSLV